MIDTLKNKSDFKKARIKCAYHVNITCGIKLSTETLDKIEKAEDFDDLFLILCRTPYWNWMNIRILEKMVGDCPPAQELIDEYKSKVHSRKLKDVLSDIPILDIPINEYTKVEAKCNKDFNEVTIKDIAQQWNEIEIKFDVKEVMLLQSISKGCAEICWLLPNELVDHAKKFATPKLFPEMQYLKIGKDFVKDDITGMQIKVCR